MATNKNFEVKNGLTVAGTERISSAGAFTGSLASATTATTQSATDNSTKIATTAYTDAAITAVIGGAPGTLDTLNELAAAINDDASYASTLTTALATKLPLAGGTMTGNLVVNAIVDADNFKINGAQGSDGQVLTSTGSGVAWEAASGGMPTSGGTFTGNVNFNSGLRSYTSDDQANYYSLYTDTDDTFKINYNGSGADEFMVNAYGRTAVGQATTFNAGLTSGTDIRATGASFGNDGNSITMSQESTGGSITARGPNGSTRGTIQLSVNEDNGANGIIALKVANTGKIGIGTDATSLSTLSVGHTTAHNQNRITIFTDDYNYGCMRIGSSTAEASLGFFRSTTEANTNAANPSGGNNTWGFGCGVWGANFGLGSNSLLAYCVEWDSSGHMLPGANNTYDLGSTAKGWRNVYTNDLHLSNVAPEGTDMEGNAYTREGNEVDGTNGSWTIQEGSDDLYLLNRVNGKKYKFNLTEVS